MPWTSEDAERHTKKATSPKLKQQWADVANSTLKRTENEALAVREANGVVRDAVAKHHRKRGNK